MKDKAKIITSIIVDDEPDARERLAGLLEKCEQLDNLACVAKPDEALEKIRQHQPDLLFLDVEMPSMSGFDLVQQLKAEDIRPHIVFVTGYSQYAIKAIKAGAYDFLLKPVDIDELRETVGRLEYAESDLSITNYNKKEKTNQVQRLKLPTHSGYVVVDSDDILFCEADGAYTIVHLKDKREFTESSCMAKVEKRLSDWDFIRISRFHLVNLSAIKEVDRKKSEVVLSAYDNQIVLKVSRKYFSELNKRIAK